MNMTLVDPWFPNVYMVSKYLICIAAFESNNAAWSFINLADYTKASAEIILA